MHTQIYMHNNYCDYSFLLGIILAGGYEVWGPWACKLDWCSGTGAFPREFLEEVIKGRWPSTWFRTRVGVGWMGKQLLPTSFLALRLPRQESHLPDDIIPCQMVWSHHCKKGNWGSESITHCNLAVTTWGSLGAWVPVLDRLLLCFMS